MLSRFGFFLYIFFLPLFLWAAPAVSVTPATQNINPGQSATVRIQTTDVEKCTITGEPYNNYDIIKNGNILLRPIKTTEYIFNCKDTAGKVIASTKASITLVPINNSVSANQNNSANTGGSGNTGSVGNILGNTSQGGQNNIQRPQTQYSNQNLQNAANQLCARYSSYSSVYPPATPGGGGGSVPVDLTNLATILLSIDRNTQLTANEFRQDNLLRYCTEYQNMARATARLAETAAKTIKNFADTCYADQRCLSERVYKSDLEKEIKFACEGDSNTLYKDSICKLVKGIGQPQVSTETESEIETKKKCAEYYDKGFLARECVMPSKPFQDIVDKYYEAKDRIAQGQNQLAQGFNPNGVMGSRPCTETFSGRAPEEVPFYDADCVRYRIEPSVVNEEALRQIAALPYTQAFSPSSVLGYDGVLDNINTRTREGNLVDPNIAPNFGSQSGGTNGGVVNTGTDLKSVEENYKKIATNIGVIIQLYDVARLAYSSSTSVCKNLPVATRQSAVVKIESNKKTYTDYLTNLKQLWDAALARPREDNSALITKINFDLKDKYSQSEIDKVYDAVKKLLQTCIDSRT
jgi:hypothetical protein